MAAKEQQGINLQDLMGIVGRCGPCSACQLAQLDPAIIAVPPSNHASGCDIYIAAEAAARQVKIQKLTEKVKELKEQVQVSQFWRLFRTWQAALHAQLGTAITIKSTLAALQWWAAHHSDDAARSAVIASVRRQLKQLKRKHQGQFGQDMAHDVTEWSVRLHETALAAAKELKQVTLHNQYYS
jgi:hypothetical protein